MRPEIRWLRQKLKDFPVSVRYLGRLKHRNAVTVIRIEKNAKPLESSSLGPELAARIKDILPGRPVSQCWGCIQVNRDFVLSVIEKEQCQQTTARA